MRKLFNIFTIFLTLNGAALAQSDVQIAEFAKAAKFNDVSTIKTLISQGVSPNILDPKGELMLNLAIRDKSDAVISYLLANKATDVDISNKFGETPLMIASIEGDLGLVKTLVVQNKAQINHIGWTPLHYACSKGQLEVAQYLIANGAIIDSLSPSNTTPLMMAVLGGNETLIKLLLDKGADLKLRNDQGFTAIDIAYIYEKPWIAEGLSSRWQRLYKQQYIRPKSLETSKP
ncbi:ankyrin repeat domain-containing protein [Polynucleobacter ibericus]|uniref:ankyrin repeat domain-containing protein n=1 Tax=Polynucleobacter ibericus TaxID=1819725 RepID=UPI001BFEC612|nr:ankyrin repeat domain-containing protein [Polynucleobacter ibericus]QWE09505.1 ankyrin repeat domain-containing protein [Polynucleobacter ibericus]